MKGELNIPGGFGKVQVGLFLLRMAQVLISVFPNSIVVDWMNDATGASKRPRIYHIVRSDSVPTPFDAFQIAQLHLFPVCLVDHW